MTAPSSTGAASGMGGARVDAVRPPVDTIVTVDLKAPRIDGTIGIACDVSDPDAVQALADAASFVSCPLPTYLVGVVTQTATVG